MKQLKENDRRSAADNVETYPHIRTCRNGKREGWIYGILTAVR